jgi:hypothetical protein
LSLEFFVEFEHEIVIGSHSLQKTKINVGKAVKRASWLWLVVVLVSAFPCKDIQSTPIVQELPSMLILPFFMLLTLLTILVCKGKDAI